MIACIGMTAIINTSCSNETDLVANGQQEKAGPKGVLISFGLSAEDYGADNEAATRGVSDAQTGRVIATSTSNLGNGLEVLTEVVEDNAPKTRAGSQPVPKQDYHILAYKDGEKKAEWYGNSKDGRNFINYPQSPKVQYLEPGKYKFYVFNHSQMPISKEDGTFTTDIGKGSRNAFYIEEEREIPNRKECKLEFVLKPMFARVRIKLKTYVEGALKGHFNGYATYKAGTRYGKIINPKTGVTTYTTAPEDGRFFYGEFAPINTKTEGENNEITSYSIITTENSGNFFLEGTMLSEVSFEIDKGSSATIFGKPASGTNGTIMPTKLKKDVKLEAGKSYTLVHTMYKLGSYLFSDGSVSSLAEGKSAGKTPVGFVVDEKNRIAIALNNAGGEKKQWATSMSQKATTLWPKTEQGLRDGITEYNGGNVERGGYKETWDPSKTVDQKVRAENEGFPAFNAIKDLSPVKGKKWYVPGVGDWALALKLFGIDDPAACCSRSQKKPWSKATTQGLGYKYQEIVFNQAGGTPLNSWYWTANQWDDRRTAITLTTEANGAFFGAAMLTSETYVRPFINY